MAVEVKAVPVLRDKAAKRLVMNAENNLRKRHSVDFTKGAANSYAIRKKSVKNFFLGGGGYSDRLYKVFIIFVFRIARSVKWAI